MSYFGVSDAKRRAARDRPPTKLSSEKKKKVRLQKKIAKSETDLSKKKLLSLNKATSSTSQTHTKRYPATRFQIEKWSIKNSNSCMIAETQREGLNRE